LHILKIEESNTIPFVLSSFMVFFIYSLILYWTFIWRVLWSFATIRPDSKDLWLWKV